MKLLTVSALLCALMALSTAADDGGSDGGTGLKEKVNVEKRGLIYLRRRVGWTRYGNRYYRYFPYRWTWARARRFCQSRNANLAFVHNLRGYQAILRISVGGFRCMNNIRCNHRYPFVCIRKRR